jgi:hypothetical protein
MSVVKSPSPWRLVTGLTPLFATTRAPTTGTRISSSGQGSFVFLLVEQGSITLNHKIEVSLLAIYRPHRLERWPF